MIFRGYEKVRSLLHFYENMKNNPIIKHKKLKTNIVMTNACPIVFKFRIDSRLHVQ